MRVSRRGRERKKGWERKSLSSWVLLFPKRRSVDCTFDLDLFSLLPPPPSHRSPSPLSLPHRPTTRETLRQGRLGLQRCSLARPDLGSPLLQPSRSAPEAGELRLRLGRRGQGDRARPEVRQSVLQARRRRGRPRARARRAAGFQDRGQSRAAGPRPEGQAQAGGEGGREAAVRGRDRGPGRRRRPRRRARRPGLDAGGAVLRRSSDGRQRREGVRSHESLRRGDGRGVQAAEEDPQEVCVRDRADCSEDPEGIAAAGGRAGPSREAPDGGFLVWGRAVFRFLVLVFPCVTDREREVQGVDASAV